MDSLVATLMGDAQPDAVNASVVRLETALDSTADTEAAASVPSAAAEVRSAIELLRGGQSCAAVSALLAARSALGSTG